MKNRKGKWQIEKTFLPEHCDRIQCLNSKEIL